MSASAQTTMSTATTLVDMTQPIHASKHVWNRNHKKKSMTAETNVRRELRESNSLRSRLNSKNGTPAKKNVIRFKWAVIISAEPTWVPWDSSPVKNRCNTTTHARSSARLRLENSSSLMPHAPVNSLTAQSMVAMTQLIHASRHAFSRGKSRKMSKQMLTRHWVT